MAKQSQSAHEHFTIGEFSNGQNPSPENQQTDFAV